MKSTHKTWRLLDTGLRSAAENIALNRALLECRQSDESPSTLRFLQFKPSALLGFHQSPDQELNLDYCRQQGIDVQRRITGGGAIYFDEAQLGWELYLHRGELGASPMEQISKRICEAAANGIRRLGVNARFRPRNDIEVDGKKISGTGGAFDGDALMFQGTLLIRFDVEKMLRVLRIPAEKLSDKAIASARDRVTHLADLLGYAPEPDIVKQSLVEAFSEAFGVTFNGGELSALEQSAYVEALQEIDHPGWVNLLAKPESEMPLLEGMQKFTGGMLRVRLAYDQPRNKIHQVWFTGDMFISPKRTIADLEARLRDVPVAQLREVIIDFFAARSVDMLGMAPENFVEVMERAVSGATASARV